MFKLINQLIQWLGKSEQQTPKDSIPKESPHISKSVVSLVSPSVPIVAEPAPVKEQFSQRTKESFQDKIDALPSQSTLKLWPPVGEYAGPVVIKHPLTLDGQGATLWALKGPVVSIQSDGVILRNLRIEVTGEAKNSLQEQCAIISEIGQNVQLDNVEVKGLVMGLPNEEGEWQYPQSLHLGQLAYGKEYDLLLRINVPVECKIATSISGLTFEPYQLNLGRNEVRLHLEKLPEDTLINGAIFLVSNSLKRRITCTAHIRSLNDEQVVHSQNSVVWEPSNWSSFVSVSEEDILPSKIESDVISLPNIPPPKSLEKVDLSPTSPQAITPNLQSESPSKRQPKMRRGEQPNDVLLSSKIEPCFDRIESTQKVEQSQIPDLFTQSDNSTSSQVSPKIKTASQSQHESSSLSSIFAKPDVENQQDMPSQEKDSEVCDRERTEEITQAINPLFQPTSLPSKTANPPESGNAQLPTTKSSNSHDSRSSRKKIVRSENISPLFRNEKE